MLWQEPMRMDELLAWLGWLRQVVRGYVASAMLERQIRKEVRTRRPGLRPKALASEQNVKKKAV